MSDTRFDNATWEDRLFGYGVLKIRAGHWRDSTSQVFVELMRGDNIWLGRSPGIHWFPVFPTHEQVRLYVHHLSIDQALRVANTGFDEKEEFPSTKHGVASGDASPNGEEELMSRLPTPAAPVLIIREAKAVSDEQSTAYTPAHQYQEKSEAASAEQPLARTDKGSERTISVTAFCRLSAQGVLLKPKGATDSNFYRRNEHGAIQWFDANNDKWCATAHRTEADEALTAAGWPPGLEIESIAGPYEPTPLEGRWTRFYWRTVETAVLWAKTARWVCTGAR